MLLYFALLAFDVQAFNVPIEAGSRAIRGRSTSRAVLLQSGDSSTGMSCMMRIPNATVVVSRQEHDSCLHLPLGFKALVF